MLKRTVKRSKDIGFKSKKKMDFNEMLESVGKTGAKLRRKEI